MLTRANAFLLLVFTISEKHFNDGFRLIPSSTSSIKFGRQSRSYARATASVTEYYSNLRDKLVTPTESIIRAAEKIGPNVPISVADASALSGTDLNTARLNLMTLATLTGGDLEVTQDGEIMFSFPQGVRTVLERRSVGQKLKVTYNTAYPYLYSAFRAFFGIVLLTSLAIIVFTILAATTSSSSSDSSRDDRKGSGGGYSGGGGYGGGGGWNYGRGVGLDFSSFGFDVPDMFFSRQYTGYYQSRDYRPDYSKLETNEVRISLIEGFFSFVFGDGDPNAEFSKSQLTALATRIKESRGTVVAEELAPYLDPPEYRGAPRTYDGTARNYDSYVVDEKWVLPAVLQLGGEPVVTEDGNIAYRFPQFENVNPYVTNQPRAPEVLLEMIIPFTRITKTQKILSVSLGILNLLGVGWIGGSGLMSSATLIAREPVLMSVLSKFYPALVTYAVLFNLIPLIRFFMLKAQNAGIAKRNKRREEWAELMRSKPQFIQDKILGGQMVVSLAKLAASSSKVEKKTTAAYSTKEDMSVEGGRRDRDREQLRDFDEKLL